MEQAKLAERPALTLERFYPVAPEKVWRAWTDPQALSRWFGQGWSESFVKLEQFLKED
jgi:uncharacterized protein YndB with AHSA1/START domain